MAAQYKMSTSETVENLLQSYAKRRELLRKSHYFGMSFPAIKPCKSAISLQQQKTVEDEILEKDQQLIFSTKILPLPKRYLSTESITASCDKLKKYSFPHSRKSTAKLNKQKFEIFEKPCEPEPKSESRINSSTIPVCKPTITNHIMIITNIEEVKNLEKTPSYFNIQNLAVYDVIFDQFIPYLITISKECKHLQTLELHRCHVDSFQHLEEIAQLRNLNNVVIGSSGNAITQISCWNLYLLHRMSHLSLRTINGIKITPELCSSAAQKFGSSVQMLRLSRKQRQQMDKHPLLHEIESTSEDENQRVNCRLLFAVNQMENDVVEEASRKFVDQAMANSLQNRKRNKRFYQLWPQCFSQIVSETLETIEKGLDFKTFIGDRKIKTDSD